MNGCILKFGMSHIAGSPCGAGIRGGGHADSRYCSNLLSPPYHDHPHAVCTCYRGNWLWKLYFTKFHFHLRGWPNSNFDHKRLVDFTYHLDQGYRATLLAHEPTTLSSPN
jgi:hypothetical protein